MARAKSAGNGQLEQTVASLMQLQANLMQHQTAMMQQQAVFLARASEIDARMAEMARERIEIDRRNEERFVRIEALLIEHNRILLALPDALREKIGFKVPGSK